MIIREGNGVEIWIDEQGKRVEIKSFFSQVFIDEEIERLNQEFRIWECNGEPRLSTLGKAEIESLAAKLLVLVRATTDNRTTLVGVRRKELELLAARSGEDWYIDELIQSDLLREKMVMGEIVIFPTEKLLENQRIPRRNIFP
jgi:hypothetical protein